MVGFQWRRVKRLLFGKPVLRARLHDRGFLLARVTIVKVRPGNLEIPGRLNKIGTSFGDMFLGLCKDHHRNLPQVIADGKVALMKHKASVNVSSVDVARLPQLKDGKESTRLLELKEKVDIPMSEFIWFNVSPPMCFMNSVKENHAVGCGLLVSSFW